MKKYSTTSEVAASIIQQEYFTGGAEKFLSAAYATATWKKYESALNSIKKFESYSGKNLVWPISSVVLIEYAVWGFEKKGLKSSSVDSYLNLLKNIHKMRGLGCDAFENFALKSIVRGKENLEMYENEAKATRKVMSLPLLRILGHEVAKSGWSENSKMVVWGAMCLAFFGSLRCGEILAQAEKSFSPSDTLLWEDLKIYDDDHILIHIKTPKSRIKEGEFVDVFGFEGHGVCPVRAVKKLKNSIGTVDQKRPVFCFSSGICLTRRKMNEILESLLTPHIGTDARHISCHSFRAGIPAVLAKHPKLCNKWDLMGWGRWRSDAYQKYTRLLKDQKRGAFVTITSLLNLN